MKPRSYPQAPCTQSGQTACAVVRYTLPDMGQKLGDGVCDTHVYGPWAVDTGNVYRALVRPRQDRRMSLWCSSTSEDYGIQCTDVLATNLSVVLSSDDVDLLRCST